MSELKIRPLKGAFGIEVLDVDLAHLDQPAFEAIRAAWQRDPLLLFRRQSLTETELVAFSRKFGPLDLNTSMDVNTDDPIAEERNAELFYVSNLAYQDGVKVGSLSNDELVWHTDLVFRAKPASGSIFYGVEMPQGTARTSFCNMARAYETLPDELRRQVDGKRMICKYGTENPLSSFMRANVEKNFRREATSAEEIAEIDRRTPAVTHDMILENKATGERSIYLSPNHTVAIEGLSETEGRTLFDALFDHAVRNENIYTHEWRNGDVLMWDNARLLHCREAFSGRSPRLAKRTTVYMDPSYFAVPEPEIEVAAS